MKRVRFRMNVAIAYKTVGDYEPTMKNTVTQTTGRSGRAGYVHVTQVASASAGLQLGLRHRYMVDYVDDLDYDLCPYGLMTMSMTSQDMQRWEECESCFEFKELVKCQTTESEGFGSGPTQSVEGDAASRPRKRALPCMWPVHIFPPRRGEPSGRQVEARR